MARFPITQPDVLSLKRAGHAHPTSCTWQFNQPASIVVRRARNECPLHLLHMSHSVAYASQPGAPLA